MNARQLKKLLQTKDTKYSHNLQMYLRYRVRQSNDAHRLMILKDDEGTLYIGIRDRRPMNTFVGVRLCVVMTLGGRARSNEYVATRGWKTVKSFWTDYVRKGICLLDKPHNHYTHRWQTNATITKRKCRFCGRREKLVKTRRTVIDENWEVTT